MADGWTARLDDWTRESGRRIGGWWQWQIGAGSALDWWRSGTGRQSAETKSLRGGCPLYFVPRRWAPNVLSEHSGLLPRGQARGSQALERHFGGSSASAFSDRLQIVGAFQTPTHNRSTPLNTAQPAAGHRAKRSLDNCADGRLEEERSIHSCLHQSRPCDTCHEHSPTSSAMPMKPAMHTPALSLTVVALRLNSRSSRRTLSVISANVFT